jgi:predicted cation transporter
MEIPYRKIIPIGPIMCNNSTHYCKIKRVGFIPTRIIQFVLVAYPILYFFDIRQNGHKVSDLTGRAGCI